MWIEDIPPAPRIYNDGARVVSNINSLQSTPYNLEGDSILVSEWDAYHVDRNHPDLLNRVSYGDVKVIADHATNVAGTVMGDGTNSTSKGGSAFQWKGVATKALIKSFEWFNSLSELDAEYDFALDSGSKISQNSWGLECDNVGNYSQVTQRIDEIIIQNRTTIVWSIGNSRDDGNCGTNPSSPNNNYGVVSLYSTAKNVITVGAINTNDLSMTSFSGWGPTSDNRTKPDIVASGCQVGGDGGTKSTTPNAFIDLYNNVNGSDGADGIDDNSNLYDVMCGTSMASPVVSGTAALMYQQFSCLKPYNVETPLPSTIKGILIHTAKDLNRTGPDYIMGWGLINATAALDQVIYRYFREENLSSGSDRDTYNFTINDSSKPIKVTLVWDDYPGNLSASKMLVNDLDLYLRAPNGTIYQSWTLDPANPSSPATKDGNHIDNVEQIVVENPGSNNLYTNGHWQIVVNATSCPQCPQKYSLIYKRPFQFDFPAGVSLISFPIDPYEKRINLTFGNNPNIRRMYYYEGGSFTSWHQNLTDTLNVIGPGKGYWVSVAYNGTDNNTFAEINGDPITENGASATTGIIFNNNWNLIGFNSFFDIPSNESLKGAPINKFLRHKRGSVDSLSNYHIFNNDSTFENSPFNLKAGYGAWMYNLGGGTWVINQTRSCSTFYPPAETLAGLTTTNTSQPFTIYGFAACDQQFSNGTVDVEISLKVGGVEIMNYSMESLGINQYRLPVPIGEATPNDSAEIFINNLSITQGNVTIGNEGNFVYLNISAVGVSDADADGFTGQCLDCNDNNASIRPNATEICNNNVDDNCNNQIDENCNLSVFDVERLYQNEESLTTIFSWSGLNNGTSNFTETSWRFNPGNGNWVTGASRVPFREEQNITFIIEDSFSVGGEYLASANLSESTIQSLQQIKHKMAGLLVHNLSLLENSSLHAITEFSPLNFFSSWLNNVSWALNFGDSSEAIGSQNFTLLSGENISVFVEKNYSSSGSYLINASLVNVTRRGYKNITVTI
ncbi:S8 family serine peptidase [Candidatus Woesearchaeota archaeon]|nr:S8 family serine peptidase [Candidatus Woesearchaeota archaeon]